MMKMLWWQNEKNTWIKLEHKKALVFIFLIGLSRKCQRVIVIVTVKVKKWRYTSVCHAFIPCEYISQAQTIFNIKHEKNQTPSLQKMSEKKIDSELTAYTTLYQKKWLCTIVLCLKIWSADAMDLVMHLLTNMVCVCYTK